MSSDRWRSAGSIRSACWCVRLGCRCCLRSTPRCARCCTPLEHSHIAALRATGETLHTILQYTVLDFRQPHFAQGLVLGVLFFCILAASLRVTRLWCRAICPLGALLGAVSRWSVLGLHKDPAACDKCNRCLLSCQGGDDPIGGVPWRKSECLMCMNCVGSCPHDSLQFKFFRNEKEVASPDLGRRRALTGLAAGAAVVPLMRANTGLGKSRHERLLRPPGSLDEEAFPLPLHSLRRVHEGLPQHGDPSNPRTGWPGRPLDSYAGAAHRLLRTKLRALLRGLPDWRNLADYATGKGLGRGCRRAESADPSWDSLL